MVLRIADTAYALRFLKLLVTDWEDTSAFKEGLIDKNGKRIKTVKAETKKQKEAYTIFHRLVYNIKRLVGNNKFTSLASALFLIKEETGMSEEEIKGVLSEVIDDHLFQLITQITEDYRERKGVLNKGIYQLNVLLFCNHD